MTPLVLCVLLSLYSAGGAEAITLHRRPQEQPTDFDFQCYVDAGILVTFPGNTSAQRQTDVLNSLLFAQLAAAKNYSRENSPEGWFNYFEYVLQNIGWVLTSDKFEVAVGDDYFVLASLALNQMAGNRHWPEPQVETYHGFLNTLHRLPDNDTSVRLLYENSDKTNTNTTSLILCSFQESPDKKVQLNLLMFSFNGIRDTTHRHLFNVYRAKDVRFSKAEATTLTLNEGVFTKIKATIVEKLGERVKTMISMVNVPQK